MYSLLKLRDVKGIDLLMPAHGQCVEEDPYAKVSENLKYFNWKYEQIQQYYDYRKFREDAIIKYMKEKISVTI